MMVLRKKTIIIVTLVILIVAAGYVSTKYGRVIKVNNDKDNQVEIVDNTDATTTGSQAASGFFIDVKLGRENQRTIEKQTLNEIINNQNSSKEAKKKAEDSFFKLVENSETEMIIESLIKAKGFEDALVFMTDDTLNVTVKAKELKADEVSIIKNIVCKESGYPATKVTIQPKE